MTQHIEFIPFTEIADSIMEEPKPSSKLVPEWYKKLSTHIIKNNICKMPNTENTNLTVKACVPVVDAMTAGYMVILANDIIVTKDNKYPFRMLWDVSWKAVTDHSKVQYGGMTPPFGYEKDPYKWEAFFTIKTPPGYSCWFTHPTNRFDLPFLTISGFVDTDTYQLPVNLPFFLREDFEGVIPKGTPIAQVIPVKRDRWESKRLKFDPKFRHWIDDLKTVIFRSYKNRFWSKKSYN